MSAPAVLKLLGYLALLPLAGLNVLVVLVGVGMVLEPGSFGVWPGLILALPGVGGLLLVGALMAIARDAPRGAGIALGVFGAVGLFIGSTTSVYSSLPGGWLALLAPFPGSVLFVIAGWWEGRAQWAG